MALGQSFSVTPAGLEEQAQRAKKRLPTQQALQTLSMQLPKTLGGTQLAPSDRMMGAYRPGGIPDTSASQMARMVRAMSGRKAGDTAPQGPRFTQTTAQQQPVARPPMVAPSTPVVAAPKPQPVGPAPPPRVRSGGMTGSRNPNKRPAQLPAKAPNPGTIGGGYVDSAPNPPVQMAPPPVSAGPPPGTQTTPPPYQGGGNYQYHPSYGRSGGGYY